MDLDMGKEDLKKLGTENRKKIMHAVDLMREGMFYSISELRALFPDHYYQVAEFLNTMGHCSVPEKFDKRFSSYSQDNTHLTNMHFTVEAEIERQRNAQRNARRQGESGTVVGVMVEVDISKVVSATDPNGKRSVLRDELKKTKHNYSRKTTCKFHT